MKPQKKDEVIKVTVLRQILIGGEPVKAGSELSLPKSVAAGLGASGKVKPTELLDDTDKAGIKSLLAAQAAKVEAKLGKPAAIAKTGAGNAPAGGGKTGGKE